MTEHCDHCHLPIPEQGGVTSVIAGETRKFCCTGCQSVCESIHAAGLGHFYQKSPQAGALVSPTRVIGQDMSIYDQSQVQANYVEQQGEQRTIELAVEDIHCAACIWLIEQAMMQINGVSSAQVNLTQKQVTLSWDDRVTLSTLLSKLEQLGYRAVPIDKQSRQNPQQQSHRQWLYRLAFAGFAMMNMLWVSIALYSGATQSEYQDWFYWISFFIATPVYGYAGYPFLKRAYQGLRHASLTMDLPIAIGATVTYLYSCYVLFWQTNGHIYFDTVVNFIFVILLGRYIESAARKKALAANQRLMNLQPQFATVLEQGKQVLKPIESIKLHDQVIVKPGDKIPVDGVVISGESSVEQALLTGEAEPVKKGVNDSVLAGCINYDGTLTVTTEKVLNETTLSRVLALVEKAQQQKAPIQLLTDRLVPWFVLTTLLLALATLLYWLQYDAETALIAATSVLIITCPCALGIATPMSVAIATGSAARAGIILKSGQALQTLSKIDRLVLDKTGTVTEGKLKLTTLLPEQDKTAEQLLTIAASVEQYAEHSVARAIVSAAEQQVLPLREVTDFKVFPGRGVTAKLDGQLYIIGTEALLTENKITVAQKWLANAKKCEQAGISTVFIVEQNRISGMMGFEDQVRQEASLVVKLLQQIGIRLSMVSGDKKPVVDKVSSSLGVIETHAEILPEGKIVAIEQYQQQGQCVAMAGDGINDAPALAQADVSIAYASGSDSAVDTADIVITQSSLRPLLQIKLLADKTQTIIKQNMLISLGYNVLMVPLAMSALINPIVAAITMPISSLLVITNASRLQKSLASS